MKIKFLNIIIFYIVVLFSTSCVPLVCLMSGDPCKKIQLVDGLGRPVKYGSAGGDPLAPKIMNVSNDQGYLILSKHWARHNGDITIRAYGFKDYKKKFEDVPKVVILQKTE